MVWANLMAMTLFSLSAPGSGSKFMSSALLNAFLIELDEMESHASFT